MVTVFRQDPDDDDDDDGDDDDDDDVVVVVALTFRVFLLYFCAGSSSLGVS